MVGSIATTTPQMGNGSVPQQQGVSKYVKLIDLMSLENALTQCEVNLNKNWGTRQLFNSATFAQA